MLFAEAHSGSTLQEYLELLQNPAHWMFEITLVIIIDVLLGMVLWPLVKKAIAKHDREVHHTEG